ncbi:cancer-related nucleoside-triphosphatase homolog [Anticarsia gemmatalis]|uniref:cancer-related nucleoside-triphosphatase homolog n=1 Tax=Anticarsia gemmatalis TaxID=129554 RepID=UPI003F767300
MANNKYKFFILTGDPGVGKTTLTKKLSSVFTGKGIKVSGFYTEEVRNNGVREGFDIVTLDGVRGRLARDQNLLTGSIKHKVGKYGVLVNEFENIALKSMAKPENTNSHLLVIDEIGKMEFFSEPFKAAIKTIFNQSSDAIVLATIPVRRSDLLIEGIRNHRQAKVWMVTRENRNNIHEDILKEMNTALNFT